MMREVRPGVWKGEIWSRGKRKTITFHGTRKDAKQFEAEQRLKVVGEGIIDLRNVPTFAAFCVDRYKPAAKLDLRKETWDVRRYQLESLVLHFGPLKLTDIADADVEAYKIARRASVSKVTVNTELNVLSAVLSYARRVKVPCARLTIVRYRVRRKKGVVRFFSFAEVTHILRATELVAAPLVPLVTFLVETGARRREALNLVWKNVILEQRIVRIWSAIANDDDDEDDAEGDPYEVKSVEREVPISDLLLRVLTAERATAKTDWVFPTHKRNNAGEKGARYVAFPKHTWARIMTKATELALLADPNARAITGGPHKCRHTYATHFLAKKPDLYLLGRLLGHSHGRVTELYAHLLEHHLAEARNVVSFDVSSASRAKDQKGRRGDRHRAGPTGSVEGRLGAKPSSG